MVKVVPKHYWLYQCSVSADSNLDSIYEQGWRAVTMAASADGETVIILLEKGAHPQKK